MAKTTKKKLNQKLSKKSASTPPRPTKRKAYRKSTKNYAKSTVLRRRSRTSTTKAYSPRKKRRTRSRTTISYHTPTPPLKKRKSPKKKKIRLSPKRAAKKLKPPRKSTKKRTVAKSQKRPKKPRLSVSRAATKSLTRPRLTTTRPRLTTQSSSYSYWIPSSSRRTSSTRLPLTTRAKSTRIKKRCPSDQKLVCECVSKSKVGKKRKSRCRKHSKRNPQKCKSETRPCYNAHKNTCSPPANAYN